MGGRFDNRDWYWRDDEDDYDLHNRRPRNLGEGGDADVYMDRPGRKPDRGRQVRSDRNEGRLGLDRGYRSRDHRPENEWDWGSDDYGYGASDPRDPDSAPEYRNLSRQYDRWEVPGPYRGIAPRGYQRKDEHILEEIYERLTLHSRIDPSDLEVEVNDGVVTLRGWMQNRRGRNLVEDVVEMVVGVEEIDNQIKVTGGTGRRGSPERGGSTGGSSKQHGNTQTDDRSATVRTGMPVVGMNNEPLGTVQQVLEDELLVAQPNDEVLYIPFSAFRVVEGKVMVGVSGKDIGGQSWNQPQSARGEETQPDSDE